MPKSDPELGEASPPERSETLDAEEDPCRHAIHEAGHAYAAVVGEQAIRQVSIIPNEQEGSLGHVRWWRELGSRTLYYHAPLTAARAYRLERLIVTTFAGEAAEARYYALSAPRSVLTPDLEAAQELAELRTGDEEERNAYLAWLRIRADVLVASPLASVSISALANTLLARRTLTGQEAVAVMQEAVQSYIRAHTP